MGSHYGGVPGSRLHHRKMPSPLVPNHRPQSTVTVPGPLPANPITGHPAQARPSDPAVHGYPSQWDSPPQRIENHQFAPIEQLQTPAMPPPPLLETPSMPPEKPLEAIPTPQADTPRPDAAAELVPRRLGPSAKDPIELIPGEQLDDATTDLIEPSTTAEEPLLSPSDIEAEPLPPGKDLSRQPQIPGEAAEALPAPAGSVDRIDEATESLLDEDLLLDDKAWFEGNLEDGEEDLLVPSGRDGEELIDPLQQSVTLPKPVIMPSIQVNPYFEAAQRSQLRQQTQLARQPRKADTTSSVQRSQRPTRIARRPTERDAWNPIRQPD